MSPSFDNRRVLILESRRAKEMASIVSSYGGQPIAAPSMREVPLESNPEAIAFADALERDEFDLVILLTGVGTRALVAVVERVRGSRDSFVRALGRTKVVARGPKPVAALRELDVPVWVTAPEPNTWREVLSALDAKQHELSLDGRRVAVQEYGASNPDLLSGLETRGARVTRVPVYQWALPDDLGPLEAGVRAIVAGQIDVVLFTTATQVVHLLKVAGIDGAAGCRAQRPEDVRDRLDRADDVGRDAGTGDRARLRTGPSQDGVSRARGCRTGGGDPAKKTWGRVNVGAAFRRPGAARYLTLDSHNRPRRRPSQELRVHELIDHAPARLRLDTEQASGLRDGELKPRHFVEFSPDTIDERARVHSVLSLQGCLRSIGGYFDSKTQAAHRSGALRKSPGISAS